MQALHSKKESLRAVKRFRERLKEIAFNFEELEWGFPNGERPVYPTYSVHTHLGDLQIGVPVSWDTRIPHLIRFTKEQGPPSPDVELNIPLEHNRRVSGVYAQSQTAYVLCSRGSFTSYRGQIKREFTFAYFRKWLIEIDDAGGPANVIPICSMESPTIADEIASFVAAVLELKQHHKSSGGPSEVSRPEAELLDPANWNSGSEFEGKKATGNRKEGEYEFLHGPLCNQLSKFLRKSINSDKTFAVKCNQHVDAAIIDAETKVATAIFEVKTAALPSAQIYSAIGQLFYYSFKYGKSMSQLYLVLPLTSKSSTTETFCGSLGIMVVYGESGLFTLANGESLAVAV